MIDFSPLLKIIPIFLAALASPGPDFLMITSMALTRGRMAGVQAACGIATGAVFYTLLSLFGLGLLFAKMAWLITVIRICGGLYLIYLAYQLWRASLKPVTAADGLPDMRGKKRNPFITGVMTNLTNPKALAFFSSIFAVTLPQNATPATQGVIIATVAVMPVLWFGTVSFGLSAPATRRLYLRWSRWMDRVSGTFLGLFGLRLLFAGKN